MDRRLRARVLVAEAAELGLSVEDLVAASPEVPSTRSVPTVREYREQIESTFSKGTRRTYRAPTGCWPSGSTATSASMR